MKTKNLLAICLVLIIVFIACGEKLPIVDELSNKNYNLKDQNKNNFLYPSDIKNKVIITGYIFTNCPDICPLTTNNMRQIQEKLKAENISDVQFVAISFDPLVDTPEVLKSYAEVRDLDESNWDFLTGEKSEIDKLMKDIGVLAIPGDTSTVNGKDVIFYIHTDRISLIDKDYKIRKHYPGSSINIEEIITDLKTLTN